MSKEMLINVSEGEECRIALLEDGRLEELYMERTSSTSHVGNIYKGRVTNVEPSIQAAFVDFGLGRNGFLHISDLLPSYFGKKAEDVQEAVGRKMARHERPPIQRCLRRGDEIVVQIIKEGIGTKGPTLTTYLSIPGRILVMMPGMVSKGVSRKIEDETERRRLRQILDGLKPPRDCGFIIRTAGVGKTKAEIERDLKYLTRLWENLEKKMKQPAPVELYTEGDLITRTVRDVYSTDLDRIIIDHKDVARRVREFIKMSAPRTKNKIEFYDEPIPLFHKYDIEREIELMYSRHVPLPSGGSLVIDSTEAVVAIDVNSGRFRDHSDAEMTAFKTDMEAADEIPRQLRLRDLGGVIICDFIDLRYERHRRQLEQRLHDHLRKDRAKTKVLRMSQFGIIEMTRQRMRPSLKRSSYFDCPHCHGSGLVKTPESMSLDVMRRLAIAANDSRVVQVGLAVCSEVAFFLLNRKREQLAELERETGKRITVRIDAQLALDDMRLELRDSRESLVYIESLGMKPAEKGEQPGQRPSGRRRGRDRDRGHGHFQPARQEIEEEQQLATGPSQPSEDEFEEPAQTFEESGDKNQSGGDSQQDQRQGRRRRRRGRGRGRGNQEPAQAFDEGTEQVEASDFSPASPEMEPVDDIPAESTMDEPVENEESNAIESAPMEEADEETPSQEPRRGRRRRRGGRGGRRDGSNNGQAQPKQETRVMVEQAPPKKAEPTAPPMPVVRTGSTDRHLIEDEPVNPEPVRRPRTYRDLDAIPDDLD
ncbi:MAG TPA: Rne/Rng family ribonuclease [Tepidisphaeraceae bacterium]|nr:Rne/Rng family ribonuclease [Tepidisphaeraceae bacterium]